MVIEKINGENNKLKRILLIDDEDQIRRIITKALSLVGYEAYSACNGEEALALLTDEPVDLIILDMNMPGLSGVDLMERIHRNWPEIMVIVLTGHASVESAIAAVKITAVDYLLKPVSVHQIINSISTAFQKREADLQLQQLDEMLKTISSTKTVSEVNEDDDDEDTIIQLGEMKLDTIQQRVELLRIPKKGVALTRGETIILKILMSHVEVVISCAELVRYAWGQSMDEFSAQSIIRPYISRLRQKLEKNPKKPAYICTVRNRGYMFQMNHNKQHLDS